MTKNNDSTVEPESVTELPLNSTIFRYMTFERFVNLVETKELFVTKSTEFHDPYEDKMILNHFLEVDDHLKSIDDSEHFVREISKLVVQYEAMSKGKFRINEFTSNSNVINRFNNVLRFYNFLEEYKDWSAPHRLDTNPTVLG